MVCRTQKLQFQWRLLSDNRLRGGIAFQALFENALDPVDIDQIKVQGAPARGVETVRSISIRQAQQLLRLPQTAPGELAFQEFVGEVPGCRSQLPCFVTVEIRPAHGERRPALGIVGKVGGAASAFLTRMRFDQIAMRVDPDQDRSARTSTRQPIHRVGSE